MSRAFLVAMIALFGGAAFAIAGTYVLIGVGWAMLVAATLLFGFAGIILRGLRADAASKQ